ncbi:aryl-sulfate sulfotransferase [Candidatus Allofournierella excrementigallinarum]|uniref:aryl-sulfate sulfotransferase n=1 Tax=Candidatus Allofournierella excrementigallinarum TaxID=2838592 RepID=UPI00374F23D4
MRIKQKWKWLLLAGLVLAALAVLVPVVVVQLSKAFTAREQAARTDWTFSTGDVVAQSSRWEVDLAEADLGDGLKALQLVPQDIGDEDFTYYDEGVQERLYHVVEELKHNSDLEWTASMPLAILNPYGTGSNGLYLYFETDMATSVSYTVHVDGLADFTAEAADASGKDYAKAHEFQLIGLVPGEVNEVTLNISGKWGNTRQTIHFTVDMPQTRSGYATQLEVTEGESSAAQAGGLFAMMRVNGYLGYGFFFDNDGVMRYEMVLEGYGLDRVLFCGDEILTCVSSSKLARINGLGQVTWVCDLGGYDLHHDIGWGADGEGRARADARGNDTVEDRLLSIDTETGEVTELVNFSALLQEYYGITRPVAATDDFFWQAGEWDWIHLNSLQYMPESDSVILSSRETSTILKVADLHGEPALDWLAGDERIWEGTAYEDACLAQEGGFVPQYGQHCVEYYADGEEEGVYYLSLFNNNYLSINSRDLELTVDGSVGRGLYGGEGDASQVYIYRIDENQRTFSLEESFDVPYSSIVSNGSLCGDGNWTVNSGVAMVFGEYDFTGALIRQYAYECTMQNYRTFKYEMGIWFR